VQDIFDYLACYFAGCPTYAGNPNPHDTGYRARGASGCAETMAGMSAMTSGLGAGVHLFSGELFRHEVDLVIPGRGIDFVWARTYRSQQGRFNSAIGHRWGHSYDIYLRSSGADVILHDGALAREDVYTAQPANSWHNPEFFRSIVRNPNQSYTVFLPDGMRWSLGALDGSAAAGKITAMTDRNGNSMTFIYAPSGELDIVIDTLGRAIGITWSGFTLPVTAACVEDFAGRVVLYSYYNGVEPGGSYGDLKTVTTPAVTGTPTGNDFPAGRTTTYTYTSSHPRHDLNHLLLTITDARGQMFLRNEFNTTVPVTDPSFGRLTRQTWGNLGDVIDLVSVAQTPSPANHFAARMVIVNDRVGNVKECFYNASNRGVLFRELTGRADPDQPTTQTVNRPGAPLRPGDPAHYETRWTYAPSGLPSRIDQPNGNATLNAYDTASPNWLSRGNLLQRQRLPGPLGGDQPSITESWQYLSGFGGGCGCGGGAGDKFVTSHTDGRGNTTTHSYDAAGNRVQTTFPVAPISQVFAYNAFGQLTSSTLAPAGPGTPYRINYEYHASGSQMGYRRAEIVDPGGLSLTKRYEYDPVGNIVAVIDPGMHRTDYIRNQLNEVVRVLAPTLSTPSGSIRYQTDYIFDANGNVDSVRTANFDDQGALQANSVFTWDYEQDILNRITRIGREIDAITSAVTLYEYDASGNLVLTRSPEAVAGSPTGSQTAGTHDERDLPLDVIRGSGGPAQNVTRYDFDGNRNLKRTTMGTNGAPQSTVRVLDGYNRVVLTTDPMENSTALSYDGAGDVRRRLVRGEVNDVAGAANNVDLSDLTILLDPLGRVTQTEERHIDLGTQVAIGDGLRTHVFVYDGRSRLIGSTDDNGRTTTHAYDGAARRASTTDAAGNATTYMYNADSLVTGMVKQDRSDLAPGSTQLFAWTYGYDGLHRRASETDNVGTVRSFMYNSLGDTTRIVDGRGTHTRREYDGLRQLVRSVIDMNNNQVFTDTSDIVTTSTYDLSSRLIAQSNDNGYTTRHAYDNLGRRVATRRADGTVHQVGAGLVWPLDQPLVGLPGFTNGYDVHWNPVTSTDANGTATTSQFDLLNRRTRRDITPGAGVSAETTLEEFAHDGRGRLVSAMDDDSVVTRQHDSLGHCTREALGPNATLRVFDAEGNVTSTTYPGGRVVTRTFDELNRALVISGPMGPVGTYSYIGRRVEAIDFGNGLRQSFTYDGVTGVPNAPGDFGVRRLVASTLAPVGGGAALETMTYAWDRDANLVSRMVAGTSTADAYQFDAADRLLRTDRGATPLFTNYAMDGAGNRATVGGGPDAGAYTMNAGIPPGDAQVNQYSATPFDTRGYDANGNTTGRDPAGAPPAQVLTYNARNQLVSFSDPGAVGGPVTAVYRYDAAGRRVEKAVTTGANPPVVTRFFYDGRDIVEERSGAGVVQATYIWGSGHRLVQMRRGVQNHYFAADVISSPVIATSQGGAVAERYRYLEFGQAVVLNPGGQAITSSTISNPYFWRGTYDDSESVTLCGLGFHYDPRAGGYLCEFPPGTGLEGLLDGIVWGDPDWFDVPNYGDDIVHGLQGVDIQVNIESLPDATNIMDNLNDTLDMMFDMMSHSNFGAVLFFFAGLVAGEIILDLWGHTMDGENDTDGDGIKNSIDNDDDDDGIPDGQDGDRDGDGDPNGTDSHPDDPKQDITPESESGHMLWDAVMKFSINDVSETAALSTSFVDFELWNNAWMFNASTVSSRNMVNPFTESPAGMMPATWRR